jgi:transposase-like protein/IS1 family transposase
MTCHNCNSRCKKFGKHRNGLQRFRCKQCRKTFTEDHATPLGGMYTRLEDATKVIELLTEGCSVSTVERVTGIHHTTILSLLVLVGDKCERLLESRINNLPVSDVQCDEIWGFVGCKEKNNVSGSSLRGDAYCFVAIERNTKLVLTWHLGRRSSRDTFAFTEKINEATQGQFQITTDGFKPYVDAVQTSLGTRVDFAQLIKVYSSPRDGEVRYSPAEVVDAVPVPVWGEPKLNRICTSHVERQNLSIRMGMRRMTRLTNAFSKKWENLKAAYAVWFAFYNFCRVHKTLRVTPAMQAGITDHAWTITELLQAVA